MSHLYKQFENTPLWVVINKGIDDLVENNDIEETTRREYIVVLVIQEKGANSSTRNCVLFSYH